MTSLNLEELSSSAEFVGFNLSEIEIIKDLAKEIQNSELSHEIFSESLDLLLEDKNSLEKIQQNNIEEKIGRRQMWGLYLLLALALVPSAVKRRSELGIPLEITKNTLADISLWTRTHQSFKQPYGFDFDILEWSQTYLLGTLSKMEHYNFRLYQFSYPLYFYKNKKTNEIIPGDNLDPEEWELVLKPGDWLVRKHIPAGAPIDFSLLMKDTKAAFNFFSQIHPEIKPVGSLGESWFFDKNLINIMSSPLFTTVMEVCFFYDSPITEANTIRRLFGSHIERSDLASLPKEKLSTLLKAIVDHLALPENKLQARGAVMLNYVLEQQPSFK